MFSLIKFHQNNGFPEEVSETIRDNPSKERNEWQEKIIYYAKDVNFEARRCSRKGKQANIYLSFTSKTKGIKAEDDDEGGQHR